MHKVRFFFFGRYNAGNKSLNKMVINDRQSFQSARKSDLQSLNRSEKVNYNFNIEFETHNERKE